MKKENQPLISIIVPVFNVESYLRKCLDSLLAQTLKEIEVICVDDESPDKSGEILDEYAGKDHRVIVIHQKNTGLSGARNAGMKLAKGTYLMFVDSDDWVDIRICERLYKEAVMEDADSVMCSYVKEFNSHSTEVSVFKKSKLVLKEKEFRNFFYRRLFGLCGEELRRPEDADLIVSACMQLFRREICEGTEFVDTKQIGTEDALFQMMVYENCHTYVYVDLPYYHYRKTNDNSLTTTYKPELYERWQNLYARMEMLIKKNALGEEYSVALNNRIVMSMIGLGLNEISATNKKIWKQAGRLKEILSTERYKNAYREFSYNYLPLKWKVFFYLCKYQKTLLLVMMLHMIEFLRRRI